MTELTGAAAQGAGRHHRPAARRPAARSTCSTPASRATSRRWSTSCATTSRSRRCRHRRAAEEYARRLAQRGISSTALIRAYRLGQSMMVEWAFDELDRREPDAAVALAAGRQFTDHDLPLRRLDLRAGRRGVRSGARAVAVQPQHGAGRDARRAARGDAAGRWPRPSRRSATGCASTTWAWCCGRSTRSRPPRICIGSRSSSPTSPRRLGVRRRSPCSSRRTAPRRGAGCPWAGTASRTWRSGGGRAGARQHGALSPRSARRAPG